VRPSYSVLDISRAEGILGAFASWRSNLDEVLARVAQ
jgi:dTDP-4-dehydrorhamnose reductase